MLINKKIASQYNIRITLVLILILFLPAACTKTTREFNLEQARQKWNSPARQWTEAELRVLYRGEQIYTGQCAVCHHIEGTGQLTTMGAPGLKGNALMRGDPVSHIRIIIQGKNSMPAFGRALGNEDIAAVASYERNAWGNNSYDLVMPNQVLRMREEK